MLIYFFFKCLLLICLLSFFNSVDQNVTAKLKERCCWGKVTAQTRVWIPVHILQMCLPRLLMSLKCSIMKSQITESLSLSDVLPVTHSFHIIGCFLFTHLSVSLILCSSFHFLKRQHIEICYFPLPELQYFKHSVSQLITGLTGNRCILGTCSSALLTLTCQPLSTGL